MPTPQYASLESIMTASNRLHFSQADGQYLLSTLKGFMQSGRRINFHPTMAGSVKEAFDEGFIALKAADLDTDFVFIKQNAGRGLFGGQKSRVMTYVGSLEHDELMPSTLCKNVIMAMAAVNAVYRSQGL